MGQGNHQDESEFLLPSEVSPSVLRALLVGLVIGGVALRVWGLTQWSLHGDELMTGLNALFPESDPYQEGRSMPISLAPVRLAVAILGLNHLGLRLGAWLFGIGSLVVFAWGAARCFGRQIALAATALLVFSPWHLYFSQYARFYVIAFFCVTAFAFSLVLLLEEPTRRAVLLTGALGGSCAYAHTYAVLPVAAGLATAFLVVWLRFGTLRRQLWKAVVKAALLSAALMLPLAFVLADVASKWVRGQDWSVSPMHTALGLANGLGLPTALAAVGGLLMLRTKCDWRLWIMGGVSVVPALLVVGASAIVSARQDYAFAGSAGLFVLAGSAVVRIGRTWRGVSAVLAFVILSQTPSLVSYYSCGNRFPLGQAAEWVKPRLAAGDMVFSSARRLLSFYGVPESQSLSVRNYKAAMNSLQPGATAWFVIQRPRSAGWAEVDEWLRVNGQMEARIRPRRYDYFEHEVQVWRWRGSATPEIVAP